MASSIAIYYSKKIKLKLKMKLHALVFLPIDEEPSQHLEASLNICSSFWLSSSFLLLVKLVLLVKFLEDMRKGQPIKLCHKPMNLGHQRL